MPAGINSSNEVTKGMEEKFIKEQKELIKKIDLENTIVLPETNTACSYTHMTLPTNSLV